jgi:hypothetical protein
MRWAVVLVVVAAVAGGIGFWLRGSIGRAAAAADEPPLELPADGARITVIQRHDAEVPGSGGRLRVHLGDITRGQVELTLAHRDGRMLVPPTSMRPRARAAFRLGGQRYHVEVVALHNVLIGDDTAQLLFTAGESEGDRIEFLLRAIEESGLTFIRNGTEHDGPAAADHLRGKLEFAGDRITTARQFIDHIATGSSMSGKPYQVRLADGTVVPLRDWLTEQLAHADADHP